MSGPILIAVVAAAVVLLACLAAGLLVVLRALRVRARALEWELAWARIDTAPEEALATFRRVIARLANKRGPAAEQLPRARFGSALCLIKLRRFPEAEEAEDAARSGAGLSEEDEARLATTYLSVAPEPLSGAAAAAYARYLAQPAAEGAAEARRRAAEALRRALRLPSSAGAEQVAKVVKLGQRILELAPALDWVQFLLGVAYSRTGRWQDALGWFQKAAAADPRVAERHLMLGRAYRKTGDKLRARISLLQAFRLAPETAPAYEAGMACLALAEEPFSEEEKAVTGQAAPAEFALKCLQTAVEKEPKFAAGWQGLGQAQARLGKHAEAVRSLEKSLALEPRSALAHCLLGQSYLALGQRDRARAELARAGELDPNLAEAARLGGDLAYESGDYAEALRHYQRLHAVQPSTPLADRLARCYLETGKPAQAVRLLSGRPAYEPEPRLVLGRAHARQRHWKEALAVLGVVEPAAATPEYRYYLANALAANGKRDAAAGLLAALVDDPTWGARARRQLGHVKLLGGDFDGAQGLYGAGQDAASSLDLGRLYLLKHDAAAARAHFERAASGPANGKAPRLGLALAQVEVGETDLLRQLADDPELGRWAAEPLARIAYEERRHQDALASYERAIEKRQHVSSQILCRLATVYLQLGRYREALPHLVELSRRRPRDAAVRHNLAVCRYHLGRGHFRQSQWDQARVEWNRCHQLLKSLGLPEAPAVHRLELEAAYRAGARMLAANPPGDLERAGLLFQKGTEAAPAEPRWWFGAGLTAALAGDHARAATCFQEAQKLAPDHAGFTLGYGLSLQAAENDAAACRAFRKVMQPAAGGKGNPLFPVAARFALVVSHTRARRWAEAAAELEPLLADPLIRSSQRIGPSDIAQAMAAYYALGGQRDKAADVARRHLKGQQGIGDLLVGIIQAEAGDYAGAADNLERQYQREPTLPVRTVLVACLLAAAAERILKRDLRGAGPFVQRALALEPKNADAQKLQDALSFGSQLGNFDLAQIDQAIKQCEELLKTDSGSAQLVRTLGVLYHRQAAEAERKNRPTDASWQRCLKFWKGRIMEDDAFWGRYAEEYNAGKGRREQVKQEDVDKWRLDLPLEFARGHASYVGACLKKSDKTGLKRHLGLIWEWAPEFEPPEGFFTSEVGQLDDAMARLLEDIRRSVPNAVRKTLGTLLGGYWNGKGVAVANRAQEVCLSGVGTVNQANAMAGAMGAAAGPLIREMLRQARAKVDQARSMVREALDHLKKAKELAPDMATVRENLVKVEEVRTVIQQAYDNICNICRQVGIW
jgi:tetratricopeptide (TPR) repeat protein